MNRYTEQDIQDYLDGRFSGDAAALQNYLAQHPEAQRQVEMYRLLYAGIKAQPVESLSIDLAGAVTAKIEERSKAKELRWSRTVSAVVSALAVAALAIGYTHFGWEKLLQATGAGLLSVFLLLVTAFAFGFYFIEWRVKKQRLDALLQQG